MRNYCLLLFILLSAFSVQSQIVPNRSSEFSNGFQGRANDSLLNSKMVNVKLSGKTKFTDYKIISSKNDTTYIDTTLNIQKAYLFNYLRRDNFELLPFNNQGQTFNQLAFNYSKVSLFPDMGANAKHYNYYEIDDINYYHVPTPTSELFYRSGLEQGQVLDAFFTYNTSKRHNTSIAYKGLRSLGKYRNSLSSHGNMRITHSYTTKNNAYTFRGHIAAQDLTNNENGGLTTTSIINFENNDPNFKDRGRLDTNFSDTYNVLRGNRYYIEHDYKLWHRKDSLNNTKGFLKVGHILNYELKHYDYHQYSANTILGDAFTTKIEDKLLYTTFNNQLFLALKSPIILGELKIKANHLDYNYGFKSVTYLNDKLIPSSIDGSTISLGAEWNTNLKKFNIKAEAASIITGDLTGNYLKTSAEYDQDSLFTFRATLLTNSKAPNFNFLLNQSDYIQYNWYNDLKNERTRTLLFDLISQKLFTASAQITQIDNYSYFSEPSSEQTQPLPLQSEKTINYLKIKLSKELKLGKFALNNTVMYQNVTQGSSIFRVPELVTRNTLYFSDHVFKGDPIYIQTGVTFKYFTKYFANSYNPLLSEFSIQNKELIGGYPVFDFFINAQIQRTRLYFKAEHVNSKFITPNYYTAPNYPYRDFVIRFGLVWNFFI